MSKRILLFSHKHRRAVGWPLLLLCGVYRHVKKRVDFRILTVSCVFIRATVGTQGSSFDVGPLALTEISLSYVCMRLHTCAKSHNCFVSHFPNTGGNLSSRRVGSTVHSNVYGMCRTAQFLLHTSQSFYNND
jgi:hypothetical protein